MMNSFFAHLDRQFDLLYSVGIVPVVYQPRRGALRMHTASNTPYISPIVTFVSF